MIPSHLEEGLQVPKYTSPSQGRREGDRGRAVLQKELRKNPTEVAEKLVHKKMMGFFSMQSDTQSLQESEGLFFCTSLRIQPFVKDSCKDLQHSAILFFARGSDDVGTHPTPEQLLV